MNRRDLLRTAFATAALGLLPRRLPAEDPPSPEVLFVQLIASGGWDPLLFSDPKPGLRSSISSTSQFKSAGGIPYAVPDTPSGAAIERFFQAHHARMLVFNGVDTGTNNHEVGTRYSTSGSLNVGWPVFAAQVAAAYGAGRPMPLLDLGGYDEAGELVAPTRLNYENVGFLQRLRTPDHFDGDWLNVNGGTGYPAAEFLPGSLRTPLDAARDARLARIRTRLHLPGEVAGAAQLATARLGAGKLAALDVPGRIQSDTLSLIDLGMRAFKGGLAVSIQAEQNGFDTHGGNGGEPGHTASLATLFQLATDTLAKGDLHGIPVCVVICSDFGRTPYSDGNGGTDHWPVGSILLVHNALGLANTGLPADRTIGVTSGGAADSAGKSVKIDPSSFAPSDTGISITPGHVYRALRRVAKIADHPVLARFPLSIDTADLALG